MLLTTEYIEEAERLAGTVVILGHGKVIASGTPEQLQARAGGDGCTSSRARPGPRQLAAALAALGTGEQAVDEAAGRVVLLVADGTGILRAVAARLAAAGVQVSGLALRRLTLEEAFLALTGQTAAARHSQLTPPTRATTMTAAAGTAVPPGRLAATASEHCRHHRPQPAADDPGAHLAGVRHRAAGAVRAAVHLRVRRRCPRPRRGPLHRLPAAGPLHTGDRVRRLQTGVAVAEHLAAGNDQRLRSLRVRRRRGPGRASRRRRPAQPVRGRAT